MNYIKCSSQFLWKIWSTFCKIPDVPNCLIQWFYIRLHININKTQIGIIHLNVVVVYILKHNKIIIIFLWNHMLKQMRFEKIKTIFKVKVIGALQNITHSSFPTLYDKFESFYIITRYYIECRMSHYACNIYILWNLY